MARQQNFFYQSPIPSITQSLGKALFGDPAAHYAQAKAQSEADLRAAQTGEATAHGGLYDSQSEGQRYQNTSAAGLPALMDTFARSQFPQPAPAPVALDAAPPSEDPHVAGALALSHVLSAIAGAQGDKVNPQTTMSTLAAFLGGPNADTLGRGALIAGGHTPGKEFATDSNRADVIREDEQASGLAKAMGVAGVNHASDIPVANIRAGAARDVAGINHRTDIPVANIRAGAARDVAGIKVNGTAPGFDAIQRVFPNATENSGERTPEHNAAVGGVPGSYHVPGNHPGSQAYDIPVQPGMTVDQAARAIEASNPGVRVVEARDETGRVGPNGKALGGWHFALQGSGKGSAAAKPPKGISTATDRMLSSELNRQMGGTDKTDDAPAHFVVAADAATQAIIKNRVIQLYQQTGNPVGAVQQTLVEAHAGKLHNPAGPRAPVGGDLRVQANDAIARGADPAAVAKRFQELTGKRFASGGNSQPPVAGARRSPRDGLWYVQQGKHPDGTPAYARVDG